MNKIDTIFRSELEKRDIRYLLMTDGCYEIKIHDQIVTVSLENIRRNYNQDDWINAIVSLVEKMIVSFSIKNIPSWKEVQKYIRYSLEPMNDKIGLENIMFETITNELCKVYVYTSVNDLSVVWLNNSTINKWGVSHDNVVEAAEVNMSAIVSHTKLESEDIDGCQIGMLCTEETSFKSSIILSPDFRDLVSPTYGWPVYVVAPCRDFMYVISTKDSELLGRLGGVVTQEYMNSGYPITKDVLQVSDEQIKIVGTYSSS
jgi:hypothetical protein